MSKSLKAVFSPQKYVPKLVTSEEDREKLWENNRAWFLSNIAHIAYFSESNIRQYMKQLGANATRYYDNDGAQAFLAIWENRAILSFRGSQPKENATKEKHRSGFFHKLRIRKFNNFSLDPDSLNFFSNDILADMKFLKTKVGHTADARVHRGFLKEINKIWQSIEKDIDQRVGSIPIWVTGHSLGAAMATLAGMRYPFEGVVTFGEPRVGSQIHKEFKAKTHIRYVNGSDPVTMVPPELLFGYDHHGDVVRIAGKDGQSNFRYDHSIVYYSENIYSISNPSHHNV